MTFPSITTILTGAGVGFDMSHLPQEYSKRGTLIHAYAAARILGEPLPEIPDQWAGFARGVDAFQDKVKPKPSFVEGELSHPLMCIVGHPDLISITDKTMDIWDYKTGSVPAYVGQQLAGYEILARWTWKEIEVVNKYSILLTNNGKFKVKSHSDPMDRQRFLDAYHKYFELGGVTWNYRG